MTNEKLSQIVSSHGGKSMQLRQISKRLKDLLPSRLNNLVREHRQKMPPGKASRQALADLRYENFISELTETSATALEARITWETHKMLADARRSINAFNRRKMRR